MKKIILGLLLTFSVSLADNHLTTEEEAFIFKEALAHTIKHIGDARAMIALYLYTDITMTMTKNEITNVYLCMGELQLIKSFTECNQKDFSKFTTLLKDYSKQQRRDLFTFMTIHTRIIIEYIQNEKKRI